MDGRDYKNYKIAFNTLKKNTIKSISPNLSHLNSTFSAPPVFDEVLTNHNVQETVHVLKSNDPCLVRV